MTDDDPLDLPQVAADADALDALRSGRRAGDLPGDPALAALHELLSDVVQDLPEEVPLVPGLGSSVQSLSGDRPQPRRLVRRGTTVAVVAAGVLSLGGVAAASTVAAPGSPLHDLRSAVASAAGAVITAVTPPERRGAPEARPTPASTASPAATDAPGATVSADARSAAAARQVAALLDAAQALITDGRVAAAEQRLDVVERRLPDVLPSDGAAGLTARLAELRAQLSAAGNERPAQPGGAKATAKPAAKPTQKPSRGAQEPAGKPSPPAPDRKPAPPGKTEPQDKKPTEQPAPDKTPGGGEKPPGQLSNDASAKPRA